MVTARSVPEWIGATPDTPAPPRVRLRVFERAEGKCHRCGRKIAAGEKWTLEHLVALINGGANAESNLSVTCGWCLPAKNAEDVAAKSRTYRKRSKHLGIKAKHRLIPGSRGTPFHKHVDGTVSMRDA
jgi:5-methylcytosine-specific restriction endonuclease McrA